MVKRWKTAVGSNPMNWVLAIFVFNCCWLILNNIPRVFYFVERQFFLPENLTKFAYKFWTPLTYFWFESSFWNVVFHLLFVYWIGERLTDLLGKRRTISVFFIANLSAAFVWLIVLAFYTQNTLKMSGSTAGLFGILWALATVAPKYIFRIYFLGYVNIRMIATVFTLLEVIVNKEKIVFIAVGGLVGYFLVKGLYKGRDFTFTRNVKIPRKKPAETNEELDIEAETNRILEKISKSGIHSLSAGEKSFLDQVSKKA